MFARKPKIQRRNISDQQSKKVYSYYSNTRIRDEQPDRDRQNTPTKRLPRVQNWWHHTPSMIALVAILVCFGYILSINPNPKIVRLTANHNIYLQNDDTYQQAANKIIAKSALNYNKITLNTAGISHDLKQQFPELTDVSVTLPLINRRPIIYINASQPTLLFMTQNNSMLIDTRGIAIISAIQVSNIGKYKLLSVRDESGLETTAGKAVLRATDVKFITDTAKQFTAVSQEVDQFILPAKANELDIKLAGQPFIIKMDMTGDSREQVGAFMAAQSKLKVIRNLNYVDVRVVGRVYYK